MKKGFTLAEVLITLGVIGVIAALTMPNLLQNHQKRVFVSQLQRTYNMISNAATQLMSDENTTNLEQTYLVPVDDDYDNAQGKFLRNYFKVAKDCGIENRAECLGDKYYSLDRSASKTLEEDFIPSDYYCVNINTGATICMEGMSNDRKYVYDYDENDKLIGKSNNGWHEWAKIIVDVNGKSGPNTNGRDLFAFELYSDGKMGNSYQPTEYMSSGDRCSDWEDVAEYGGSCFQAVMSKGWVMDY